MRIAGRTVFEYKDGWVCIARGWRYPDSTHLDRDGLLYVWTAAGWSLPGTGEPHTFPTEAEAREALPTLEAMGALGT
jgi:hypothetical protein